MSNLSGTVPGPDVPGLAIPGQAVPGYPVVPAAPAALSGAVMPLAAQAGQTWQRAFWHRQQPPPLFQQYSTAIADAGTGTIQASGSKAVTSPASISGTGTIAVPGGGATSSLMPPAQPGLTWQRAFWHRQQPVVQQPANGTAIADAGTGTLNSAGSKAVTSPAAISGTGTLSSPGAKASSNAAATAGTGVITTPGAGTTTPVMPPAQPGQSWIRQFWHRQYLPGTQSVIPQFTGSVADAGTGTIQVTGTKAGAGAVATAGTGTLAGAGTKASTNAALTAGTGTIQVPGAGTVTPVMPASAFPGLTWLRNFWRRVQQPPGPPPSFTGSAVISGTGTMTAIPPGAPPVFPPGVVLITPYGPGAALVTIARPGSPAETAAWPPPPALIGPA